MNHTIMDLTGKVAVVTGATGGIGQEICKKFINNGATVVGAHIHPGHENIRGIDYYIFNVADFHETEAFYYTIMDKYGHIDILVNNAGISNDAMTKRMSEEQFDKVIDINLKGTWNMTRYIGPQMQARGEGSIINIASVVGVYGNIGLSNYAASKAGVIGLTKSWAREFALKNGKVRVNALSPGYINTKMLRNVPENIMDDLRAKTMLGRLGEPEEVANTVLFLASDLSSYITGANINMNGGMRL